MSTKLNAKLSGKAKAKSLACWLLMAASCPQVLAIAPIQAQNQNQVSANQGDVVAVASRITDINTSVTGDRLNLTLNFASSDRPQVTYTRQGKAWVALLNGAQLQLGNGNASYARANPMPGITSIEATQYAANKVKIRVNTVDPEVLKNLIKRQDTPDGLILSLETQPSVVQDSAISAANAPESGIIPSQQNSSETLKAPNAQNSTSNPASVGKPLFEPKVTITSADGKTRIAQTNQTNTVPPPVANPVTPQLPGRVPGVVPPFRQLKTPPVGDIATSTAKLRPDIVDLGTAERVPRITLREAPAIEVLTLIGRVAGLSVVSAEAPSAAGAAAAPTSGGLKQPVSLSIENETAQDVFNNVLRISGLEANRIGQTIFVATKLPVTLKNLVNKSYRLNQISVGEASAYLIGLGASRVVNRQRPIPGTQTAQIGTASQAIVNIPTESVPTLETVAIPPDSGATPLLKGLQVIAEERGNSLTLIGTPKQIEFAEAQLARIDNRKRQVVVNVRIVDVQLTNDQTFGSSLTSFSPSNGNGTGTTSSFAFDTVNGLSVDLNNGTALGFSPQRFLASLEYRIEHGSAKVLTDPSITVQEGQSSSLALTEEIIEKIDEKLTPQQIGANTIVITSQEITLGKVGLSLNIQVDRIDDNGFVSLSVSPKISAPLSPILGPSLAGGTRLVATPKSERTMSSGQIRLRDGQTLILSGVIRDSDRHSVQKVPILGDLPLIGALFRRDETTTSRSEVIIVVTPRIVDDSQNANWGYTYQPGPEVQKVIDNNQRKVQ